MGRNVKKSVGKNKYVFVFWMLLAITLAGGIFTKIYLNLEKGEKETDKIRIVTSFYPIYIAAKNIVDGSGAVVLENLSEPQTGCMHDYQLTPQDMITLAKADLFLVNGGGIEGFLTDVGKSYPNLSIRMATEGLPLLEDQAHVHDEENFPGEEGVHGEEEVLKEAEEGIQEVNAHGWMDTRVYAGMVKNIADVISGMDNENASLYQENANAYCEEIELLSSQIEEIKDTLPDGENVVIFHEAYEYVAEQYGLSAVYCLDLDEERQVSAGETADLLEEMEENHVSVILAEELYGKDMGKTVEKETGCKVYYLDTLVRGEYDKDSYLKGMQKNIDLMKQALHWHESCKAQL